MREWTILAVALIYPSCFTWVYFVWLTGAGDAPRSLAQAAYALGKVLQFALPIAYVALASRRDLSWRRPTARGMIIGTAFGALVAAVIGVAYVYWLGPSGSLESIGTIAAGKLRSLGMATPVRYCILAVFYSVIHSGLEEYYWRWFVFGRLRRLMPMVVATGIGSIGFMAHHVVLLGVYLPGRFWWLAVPLGLAVAVGGAVWCWLYEKERSLVAPWLSHALVDAAIFAVGYDLIYRGGPM